MLGRPLLNPYVGRRKGHRRMSPIKLQTREDGIASLCPITEFEVRIATNEMVVLVLQYVENIEQFDSGQWKQIQAVLSAGRARELGATLEKAAALFLKEGSYQAVQ
jgi:hypothetical protein